MIICPLMALCRKLLKNIFEQRSRKEHLLTELRKNSKFDFITYNKSFNAGMGILLEVPIRRVKECLLASLLLNNTTATFGHFDHKLLARFTL